MSFITGVGLTSFGKHEGSSSLDLMSEADTATGGVTAAAIRQAIADKDRQAFYAASTRAMAGMIRYQLAVAESKLAQAGEGLDAVLEAERYYRAFHDHFMEQSDPVAVLTLSDAWKELENSVGSSSSDASGYSPCSAWVK